MSVVFKYPIEIKSTQTINLPKGSLPMHVGLDPTGRPCVWAEVDPEAELTPVTMFIVGTGHTVPPERGAYLGSFVDGVFVWHVYY